VNHGDTTSHPPTGPPAAGQPANPDAPVVLVVDDDGPTRLLARTSLNHAGFRVDEAADGQAAIQQIRAVRPDIVLLDVMMPRMDGFATCRRIRSEPDWADLPILVVTALDDHVSIGKAFEAGATDFATKPIRWATLHHRIRYMLRASGTAKALRRSEARLANAQRIARLGHWEWDVEADRLRCSEMVFAILGTDPDAFDGNFVGLLNHIHRHDRRRVARNVRNAVRRHRSLGMDCRVVRPGGSVHVVRLEAEVLCDDAGQPTHLVGTVQDITERREAEDRIRHLALHDTLTDLPNRVLFKERLVQTLDRARVSGRRAAVLFVGLDRFNRINASLGYDLGDQLLKEAALRLTACLKDATPAAGHAEISRFGGDEFTVVLADVAGPEEVATVAGRILDILSETYVLGGREVFTTTSIGIALCPEDGDRVVALLKNADAALRHAKRRGKNNFQFYTAAMNADAERRLDMESKLRRALENDEISLHYQPKVETASGRLTGVEALIRWHHPELGNVPPSDFIPLAEETGLIVSIGEWVLATACAQAVRWRDEGLMLPQVAVNLSARQFWHDDLARTVGRVLAETGLEPERLELELTESTIMRDAEATIAALRALKGMGVKLAVDDFGTGYSSLGYLQRFPIDALKVDRSFIRDVTTNADSAAITRTVIAMGRNLNLTVVAEGVETGAQFDFLREEGCHQVQGYLISRPLPAAEMTRLLAAGGGRVSSPSR
jgi:diguanylate cyclase (GGDEF)-like protein/PAS domain S-box-containing protein